MLPPERLAEPSAADPADEEPMAPQEQPSADARDDAVLGSQRQRQHSAVGPGATHGRTR
jgi:hypothetical protein